MGSRSIIGGEQRRDAVAALHKPERFRLVGIGEDLQVIESAALVGLRAEEIETGGDGFEAVALDGGGRGHEGFVRARLEPVHRLGVIEGDFLWLEFGERHRAEGSCGQGYTPDRTACKGMPAGGGSVSSENGRDGYPSMMART